jgi:chemotaxis protein methyltransferase CheR
VNAALKDVAALVLRETGVSLKPSQHGALRTGLGRVAPGSDPVSFLRLVSDPVGRPELIARLIDEVTVQETSFLRDRRQLETIDWPLLLETARTRGAETIRVWSAACATGEEPYSLALLACEAFATDAPPVRILATNISRAALGHAHEGNYGPRSVRELDQSLRERYFHQQGDQLRVHEGLRKLVTFAQHNLVRDPIPPLGEPPFHLILCRNVLIYFEGQTAERVVNALEKALQQPGMLLLGAADALCVTGLRSLTSSDSSLSDRRPRAVSPTFRRPLRRMPEQTPADRLARAFQAADNGKLDEAMSEATELLVEDPLNAQAYFLRGLVQLEAGNAPGAVKSLRGALYIFPTFGPAAFKLGRAYEVLGDRAAARRSYEQALRALETGEDRHELLLEQVDPGDIAAACRGRIVALG